MGGAKSYLVCLCTLFFVFVFEKSVAQTCTQDGYCKCNFPDGKSIDLNPLSKSGFPPAFNYQTATTSGDSFQYAYNPCVGFTDPASGSCSNVAVCQRNDKGDLHYNLGDPTTAKFNSAGNEITYTSPGRTTNVELKCSQSATKPSYKVIGQEDQTRDVYKLEITSCHCCQGGCTGSSKKGLSFGSILCIIFVVLLFVYLVGGVIFMRYARGASGKEVIPNVGFWEEFPLLVKDGFVFVASCCKQDAAYESI